MELNKAQTLALSHKNGPLMVLAGPGSGKTTLITHRVKHLIEKHDIEPDKIVVITFTKAAAEDMKKRYQSMDQINNVHFSTFHSLFFKILKAHTNLNINDVLKDEEKLMLLKDIVKNIGVDNSDEEFFQDLTSEMSLIKNDLIDINFYNSFILPTDEFRQIVNLYENYKRENHKLDFDDMLSECYRLLSTNSKVLSIWQNKFLYIMIDEFQDINNTQYAIIKLLAQKHNNLCIVGDDDQSIYRFRGARPEFLLEFPKNFEDTKTTILDINYRSTELIVDFSNKIIRQNKLRYDKVIKGTGKQGDKPIFWYPDDINTEAINIATLIKTTSTPLDEICVVYRTNMQSRAFIDAFSNFNIPFKVKDGVPPIYDHFIARDICAYFSLSLNTEDNNALERIINKPKRYINKGIINTLKKDGGSIIENFFTSKYLKNWQLQRIEELLFYLLAIKKRGPYDAIKYLRSAVGYDSYLKEFANYKKINSKGLFEVLDEISEGAKNFEKKEEFLNHAEMVLENYKNKASTNLNQEKGVLLSTMHGVKGLEFDTVFVVSCVEGVTPHEKSKSIDEIEEERRMFYVAATRAKNNLYFSIPTTRYEEEVKPTRFLESVLKEMC